MSAKAKKDSETREPTALFKKWSSHPESLERQKKKWLAIGLAPLGVGVGALALLLTGTSGWRAVLGHPGVILWLMAGLAALSLGAVTTFALLLMMGRGAVASKTQDEDRIPFPWGWVVAVALYWMVPAGLTLVQERWGVRLVPQQVLFVMNLLCFAPLVGLLAWVRKTGGGAVASKHRGWVPFVALYAGLAGLTLLGDAQGWLAGLKLPGPLAGLTALGRRVALLAGLLPIWLVVWALYRQFRGAGKAVSGAGETSGGAGGGAKVPRKPWWRRLWDFLFEVQPPPETPPLKVDSKPPKWLEEFCRNLPDGVRVASRKPPLPDSLPEDGPQEVSKVSKAPEADPFWMLMGGDETRRPTECQVEFFKRFRDAWNDSVAGARNGDEVSPDLILSGDGGSGRTEALFVAALYAAFARRQRVFFLVSDPLQAAALERIANERFRAMHLDVFLSCGTLEVDAAKRWTRTMAGGEGAVPPNIVVATPRMLERVFFEGRGADAGMGNSEALPALLRLFEVVLVDDFTELDEVERAHLPFLLHKMRMMLASGNRRGQFVVVSPKLRGDGGVEAVARMLGAGFNAEQNWRTLLPRPCEPAWSLPLVVRDGLDPAAQGNELAKRCLSMTTEDGERLRVVVYRRGLHPDQCSALESQIAGAPEERKALRVVSRFDELGTDRGADAVFHLTALSGRSEMAIRLSAGDSRTVYIGLSSESEAIFASAVRGGVLPAVPDSSAVGLRVHHLRSLLRHIRSGQPLDVSVWERFGVSLRGGGLRVADPDVGAVAYEIWMQDEWKEDAYGEPPLWPYVVYEGHPSTKSNAGKGTDFGLIPPTDEDIVRIGDSFRMGLARPRDAEVSASRTGMGAVARWVDTQEIPRGAVDLAHAERLLFGKSALGDTMTNVAKGGGAVYTVRRFLPPEKGNGADGCWRLQMMPWHGTGRDLDTPVRTLAWFVEPGGAPLDPEPDTARAVTVFGLPDFRRIPRHVEAAIVGLSDRWGEAKAETPRRYGYEACFLGVLLAPRRLKGDDAAAQVQQCVAGAWDTADDGTFSRVLTHLFTGTLKRFIPDFGFYALFPVFHRRNQEESVAPAIGWVVQPRNTGRAVEEPVQTVLQSRDGPDFFKALREARKLFETRPDELSRLRWLRSFSGVAFAGEMDEPEVLEAFKRDMEWSLEVLDALDARIGLGDAADGGGSDGFGESVPDIVRHTSWMSAPRVFDAKGFAEAAVWKSAGTLPVPPSLGASDVSLHWNHSGRDFDLSAGFGAVGDLARYVEFFGRAFRERVSQDSYVEYGFNDPYREFTGTLAGHLGHLFEQAFPKGTPVQKAEFLLSFVQLSLSYKPDPKNRKSDWPRHPSEMVLRGGGDCEDSSILYAELLRHAGIGNAILSIPRHAAVGVDVPMEQTSDHHPPIIYEWMGVRYVYAETAIDRGLWPLGRETDSIPSAELVRADIIPTPVLTEDDETPIRILNATGSNSCSLTVTLLTVREVPGTLAVAVFARPRKEVFAEPVADAYPCVGGALLPTLKPFEVMEANLKLSSPKFNAFWYDVFVCETEGGAVRGHFVGVVRYQ